MAPNETDSNHSPVDSDRERLLALIDAGAVAYWTTLGITVEEVDRGAVTLRLAMRDELGTRRPEVMHGGAIASLVDAAAGAATATTQREDDDTWSGQATTDLNVSFLNAATGDVLARSRVLRGSRSLVFVEVSVEDLDGTPIAAGRATYAIIRRR
jgi:uncharacterized protein (TIGR00369 family)